MMCRMSYHTVGGKKHVAMYTSLACGRAKCFSTGKATYPYRLTGLVMIGNLREWLYTNGMLLELPT